MLGYCICGNEPRLREEGRCCLRGVQFLKIEKNYRPYAGESNHELPCTCQEVLTTLWEAATLAVTPYQSIMRCAPRYSYVWYYRLVSLK